MITMNETEKESKINSLRSELELQEIDAPGCRLSPELYAKLLAIYLIQNDLCNAKFLWKRIPEDVKKGDSGSEISKIWNIGQSLWKKDHSATFEALKTSEWSEHTSELMAIVTESTRQRYINLVESTYSSICIGDFSKFVGLSESDAQQLASQQVGWSIDADQKYILINPKPVNNYQLGDGIEASSASEEQLRQLTNFISFLEK